MAAAGDWLERVRIDWTDFAEASRVSTEIVRGLAADRALLRRMVLEVEDDKARRVLAEKHGEISYVVLHDALHRGLRVRIHQFHKGQQDLPHSHRYSFSSALLSGSYVHTLYAVQDDDVESSWSPRQAPSWHAAPGQQRQWALDQPDGTFDDADLPELTVFGQRRLLKTVQDAGTSYTLHHSAIHNVAMPQDGAFSVFCRGPVEKRCALELNPVCKTYRWKFGRQNESNEVLDRRRMSPNDFRAFVHGLEDSGVI